MPPPTDDARPGPAATTAGPDRGARTGTAAWSTAGWRDEAVAWVDARLAEQGRRRTGDVEQPHLRPWATVLRVPTDEGPVWLKAASAGTAFEVGLYGVLAEAVPDAVLVPLAADDDRGWVLLPDGGPTLRQRFGGEEQLDALVDAFAAALVRYGALQRALQPRAGALVELGLVDMRPARMLARFAEAVEVTRALLDDPAVATDELREAHAAVVAATPRVEAWCATLVASPIGASLDHNDLHTANVLADGDGAVARFYDWGDAVVAHPFAAMLVAFRVLRDHLGTEGDDHPRLLAARDAYLDGFRDQAPGADDEELVATFETACHVAKVARALTWDRAVRAARADGAPVDAEEASAPLEWLATVLDASPYGAP